MKRILLIILFFSFSIILISCSKNDNNQVISKVEENVIDSSNIENYEENINLTFEDFFVEFQKELKQNKGDSLTISKYIDYSKLKLYSREEYKYLSDYISLVKKEYNSIYKLSQKNNFYSGSWSLDEHNNSNEEYGIDSAYCLCKHSDNGYIYFIFSKINNRWKIIDIYGDSWEILELSDIYNKDKDFWNFFNEFQKDLKNNHGDSLTISKYVDYSEIKEDYMLSFISDFKKWYNDVYNMSSDNEYISLYIEHCIGKDTYQNYGNRSVYKLHRNYNDEEDEGSWWCTFKKIRGKYKIIEFNAAG